MYSTSNTPLIKAESPSSSPNLNHHHPIHPQQQQFTPQLSHTSNTPNSNQASLPPPPHPAQRTASPYQHLHHPPPQTLPPGHYYSEVPPNQYNPMINAHTLVINQNQQQQPMASYPRMTSQPIPVMNQYQPHPQMDMYHQQQQSQIQNQQRQFTPSMQNTNNTQLHDAKLPPRAMPPYVPSHPVHSIRHDTFNNPRSSPSPSPSLNNRMPENTIANENKDIKTEPNDRDQNMMKRANTGLKPINFFSPSSSANMRPKLKVQIPLGQSDGQITSAEHSNKDRTLSDDLQDKAAASVNEDPKVYHSPIHSIINHDDDDDTVNPSSNSTGNNSLNNQNNSTNNNNSTHNPRLPLLHNKGTVTRVSPLSSMQTSSDSNNANKNSPDKQADSTSSDNNGNDSKNGNTNTSSDNSNSTGNNSTNNTTTTGSGTNSLFASSTSNNSGNGSSWGLSLPPPSPSTLLNPNAAMGGPGNPFGRPSLMSSNNGEQTLLSALPSRYVNDLLPSPSNFYSNYGSDWGFVPFSGPNSAGPSNNSNLPLPSTSSSSGSSLNPNKNNNTNNNNNNSVDSSKDKQNADSNDSSPQGNQENASQSSTNANNTANDSSNTGNNTTNGDNSGKNDSENSASNSTTDSPENSSKPSSAINVKLNTSIVGPSSGLPSANPLNSALFNISQRSHLSLEMLPSPIQFTPVVTTSLQSLSDTRSPTSTTNKNGIPNTTLPSISSTGPLSSSSSTSSSSSSIPTPSLSVTIASSNNENENGYENNNSYSITIPNDDKNDSENTSKNDNNKRDYPSIVSDEKESKNKLISSPSSKRIRIDEK